MSLDSTGLRIAIPPLLLIVALGALVVALARPQRTVAAPQRQDVQAAWLALARKRRDDIRSGTVTAIPGKEGSAMVHGLVRYMVG